MTVIIKEAESPLERDMSFELRCQVYCKIGSFKETDFPDGKETDYYDDYAFHIIALENNDIVGTLRLIRDSPRGFLMEKDRRFKLPTDLDRDKTFEISRVILSPKKRGGSLYLFLLKAAYIFSKKQEYTHWCAALTESFDNLMRRKGWRLVYLGEAVDEYYNARVIPVIIHLDKRNVYFPHDNRGVIIKI